MNAYEETVKNLSGQTTTKVDTERIGCALKEISIRLKELKKECKDILITDKQGDYYWTSSTEPTTEIYTNISALKDKNQEVNCNNLLENDIEALKKKIKYAKTPMERKQLSKQLNIAYKKRKGIRNNDKQRSH